MSFLMIEVTPEVEQRLQEEAEKSGRSVADVAFAILRERLVSPSTGAGGQDDVQSLFEGLPCRTPADLLKLAEAQVVSPGERFEHLLGDFWPEDETCVEFLAWLRQGRRVPPLEPRS